MSREREVWSHDLVQEGREDRGRTAGRGTVSVETTTNDIGTKSKLVKVGVSRHFSDLVSGAGTPARNVVVLSQGTTVVVTDVHVVEVVTQSGSVSDGVGLLRFVTPASHITVVNDTNNANTSTNLISIVVSGEVVIEIRSSSPASHLTVSVVTTARELVTESKVFKVGTSRYVELTLNIEGPMDDTGDDASEA